MRSFEDAQKARDAIMDYPIRQVPGHLQERFRQLRSAASAVDQIAGLGEFIYANRAVMDDEAKELATGLIGLATFPNAWHGLAQDGRGDKIVLALRRDLGDVPPEGFEYPDATTDPAPQEKHVILPPAESEPAA